MIIALTSMTVGFPVVGAMVLWWMGNPNTRGRCYIVAAFFGVTGLAGLGLLFLPAYSLSNRMIDAVLHGGAFGELAAFLVVSITSTLCVWMVVNVWLSYRRGEMRANRYYAWALLCFAAVTGIALIESLLVLMLCWFLLLHAAYNLATYGNLLGDIKANKREYVDVNRYDIYG